ncbi:adenine nucleotide alpha hydrolase family protein [Paenibacillus durus]|uniref:ATPase n=1 Tax=Paenibacillus durus TaxID=44251 RepID=A0A089HSA5_PAEDU|nr:hypothetical protein [Paenibacillus durus]AIQ13258.1 hypothetical protein PDUR_16090 [Paenibacillus durus]
MKRCTRCVLPETYPGITFDSDGVCSLCRQAENRSALPSYEKLRVRLSELLEDCKSVKHRYDALVAFSGGKDSTFLIHTLKEKYGLSLLACTFDNGYMSEASFRNMRTVLNAMNVDHLIVKPRADMMNKIFLGSSEPGTYPPHLTGFGSGICISCIRMVTTMSLRVAIEKGIPLVMLGNSPGQLIQSENEIIFQDNKIPYELRKNLFRPLADRLGDEVYDYVMLSKEEYRTRPFPYTVNAFPLIGYDERNIYETISSLGWVRPEDVDPNSSNCRLNSLGIVKHLEHYGFHPYDYEMSLLVQQGIITREEALRRVEDPAETTLILSEEVEKSLMSS